jgi:hypothetical protein
MSIVNKLKSLKSNIFGGKGNTGKTKPPASTVQDFDLQSSPTGILDIDPLAFSTMSYPMDVQNNFQNGHYMLFYVNVQDKTKYIYEKSDTIKINDYDDIKGESAAEARYQTIQKTKKSYKGIDRKAIRYDKPTLAQQKNYFGSMNPEVKKGVSPLFNNTTRISDSVAMYLPSDIKETTAAAYTDAALGILGFAAAQGINLAGKDAEGIARSLVASTGQILDKAAKKAVSELAEVVTGAEGTEQLINKAQGQADNPYMEVLFDAMQLRTFTYNFTMAPRNEEEAIEIQKIIQLFRFHMAPELRGGQSRFLGLPSQFDIHYMYLSKEGIASENNYYNRVATCVLQNCEVNYTPTGVKSFEDGGPTQTTMSLTFKETELLTKDRIAEGF